jgi:hypothetical protein
MAAARAATLPLGALADALDGGEGRLRSGRRTVERRHRTLTDVVDWSEALLDDDERGLLAELGTFAGPVSADDVAAVTGRPDALDGLCRLAERSLVLADTSAAAGPSGRFGMLATIRDHARRRLAASGRAEALAERHADHVTAAVEAADALLRGPDEAAGHERIATLLDEVRAAHTWARAHDVAVAARLSAGLHLYAQTRVRADLLAWATALAERPGGDHPGVLASAAHHASILGDLDRAEALARRGIAAGGGPDDPAARGRSAQLVLADTLFFGGRVDDSSAASAAALAAGERVGDLAVAAESVATHALCHAQQGRVAQAEALLAAWEGTPGLSPTSRAWLAYTVGEVASDRDVPRALEAFDRAAALADAVGNRYVGGVARVGACAQRARGGDPAEAVGAFAAVIAHWRRQGALSFQVTTLRNLVVLLSRVGDHRPAAELVGALAAPGLPPTFGDEAARLDIAARAAEAALGNAAYAAAVATGATRTVTEAADVALAHLAE